MPFSPAQAFANMSALLVSSSLWLLWFHLSKSKYVNLEFARVARPMIVFAETRDSEGAKWIFISPESPETLTAPLVSIAPAPVRMTTWASWRSHRALMWSGIRNEHPLAVSRAGWTLLAWGWFLFSPLLRMPR